MRFRSERLRWMMGGIILMASIVSGACLSTALVTFSHGTLPATDPALPGQETWRAGVSSLLFGTNDMYEWSQHNMETEPAIQQALRHAGITLIRSFFPDKASDAEIELRMQAIENSGAHCLAVLTDTADTPFNLHLVQYLGARCQIYEFGNEADYNNVTIEAYLQRWNRVIPLLRQLNPAARFIGPATYNSVGKDDFLQKFLLGVKASGIWPDAVSFHWYPCWQESRVSCLNKARSYENVTLAVRKLVKEILGKDLPVGLSEWNYDPGNPPPAYGDDADFMMHFSTEALQAMIRAGAAFACQFDAASFSGFGRLDMIDVLTKQPRPQYSAIKALIDFYHPTLLATPAVRIAALALALLLRVQ